MKKYVLVYATCFKADMSEYYIPGAVIINSTTDENAIQIAKIIWGELLAARGSGCDLEFSHLSNIDKKLKKEKGSKL